MTAAECEVSFWGEGNVLEFIVETDVQLLHHRIVHFKRVNFMACGFSLNHSSCWQLVSDEPAGARRGCLQAVVLV